MQLTQSASLRMEQRQLLTPRMIQSMEILQLPLMALEERIEQELQNNPVLECREGDTETDGEGTPVASATVDGEPREEFAEGEQALVVKNDGQADDFDRLARISDYLESEDYGPNSGPGYRQASSYDGERDKKLDAMNNTAARGVTLQEHLMGQWAFVECTPAVRKAGEALINYVDADGYVRIDLETVRKECKAPLDPAALQEALRLIQTMDPPGIGARDLRECLLLQLR